MLRYFDHHLYGAGGRGCGSDPPSLLIMADAVAGSASLLGQARTMESKSWNPTTSTKTCPAACR